MTRLLTPREVDLLLRYPPGRTSRLIKQAKIPAITLPDGQVRVDEGQLQELLRAATTTVQPWPPRGPGVTA